MRVSIIIIARGHCYLDSMTTWFWWVHMCLAVPSPMFPSLVKEQHICNGDWILLVFFSKVFAKDEYYLLCFKRYNFNFPKVLLISSKGYSWASQAVLAVKNLPAIAVRHKRREFSPRVGKIPWRRAWQPTPEFLPGGSHRQRSLAGCNPKGHKKTWLKWIIMHIKDIAGKIHTVCCLSDCLQGLQYRWAEAVCMLFLWEVFHHRERIYILWISVKQWEGV